MTSTPPKEMLLPKRRLLLVASTAATIYLLVLTTIWLLDDHKDTATIERYAGLSSQHNATVSLDKVEVRGPVRGEKRFQPQLGDVLVLFHMQKAGGTVFNTHLVHLHIDPACVCSQPAEEGACRCRNTQGNTWLFSRFTTSSSCGVHPSLEDLMACAPKFLAAAEGYDENTKKKYFHVTVVRDPTQRYISEWKHLEHTPPWPTNCRDVENPVKECLKYMPSPLSLKDFLKCPGNPASNRMTRMLAMDDYHLCDDIKDGQTLLAKAKAALDKLDFVGITEDQVETQRLFERTFGVSFSDAFEDKFEVIPAMSADLIVQIRDANVLDMELYNYARTLFRRRLNMDRIRK